MFVFGQKINTENYTNQNSWLNKLQRLIKLSLVHAIWIVITKYNNTIFKEVYLNWNANIQQVQHIIHTIINQQSYNGLFA